MQSYIKYPQDGMESSVDPDRTAVWFGFVLFAKTYLSQDL